jgi:hypothetical protein
MRNETVGLAPNPTVSVPAVDAAGEQVVDAGGNLVTEKVAGNRPGPTHAAQGPTN